MSSVRRTGEINVSREHYPPIQNKIGFVFPNRKPKNLEFAALVPGFVPNP
jgi:hypothetical protein